MPIIVLSDIQKTIANIVSPEPETVVQFANECLELFKEDVVNSKTSSAIRRMNDSHGQSFTVSITDSLDVIKEQQGECVDIQFVFTWSVYQQSEQTGSVIANKQDTLRALLGKNEDLMQYVNSLGMSDRSLGKGTSFLLCSAQSPYLVPGVIVQGKRSTAHLVCNVTVCPAKSREDATRIMKNVIADDLAADRIQNPGSNLSVEKSLPNIDQGAHLKFQLVVNIDNITSAFVKPPASF